MKNPCVRGDKLRIRPGARSNVWVRNLVRSAKIADTDYVTFASVSYVNATHGPLLIFQEYNGSGLWLKIADGPW